jgi:hypothetical protein
VVLGLGQVLDAAVGAQPGALQVVGSLRVEGTVKT